MVSKRMRASTGAILIGSAVQCATSAHAGVIISAVQVGEDVVFSGKGTLDTSLWMYVDTVTQPPALQADTALMLGPFPSQVDVYVLPSNFTGPSSIGPGTAFHLATGGVGDQLGLAWLDDPALFVPTKYNSGDPLVNNVTSFDNQTFASLGLAVGEYTWTWATADGGTDFFTIRIIPAPSILASIALAGFVTRRRPA